MRPSDCDRLAWLVSECVEGRASAEQLAEIESCARSAEGRRFLIEYLLFLGELSWASCLKPSGAADIDSAVQGDLAGSRELRGHYLAAELSELPAPANRGWPVWILPIVLASVMLAFLGGWLAWRMGPGRLSKEAASLPSQVELASYAAQPQPGEGGLSALSAGQWTALWQGIVGWKQPDGTRFVVRGPARFSTDLAGVVTLSDGALWCETAQGARPVLIKTPQVTLMDRGTAFGVAVGEKTWEVHVAAGGVLIATPQGKKLDDLAAGDAAGRDESGRIWRDIARPDRFVRDVPMRGTVAAFRGVALSDPRLWMYTSFDTGAENQRWLAALGPVDFVPRVMKATLSSQELAQVKGFDATSRAVQIYRGLYRGNAQGVALQSDRPVTLPPRMTAEVLVRFDGWSEADPSAVGCILATRADQRRCGFFLAVVPADNGSLEQGQVVHLCDGSMPWTLTNGTLEAGHWYFLAASFATRGEHTEVTTWLSDLTQRSPLLRVLDHATIPGVAPDGVLGVGKGFDPGLAHAYPFPGAIDELALYNDVLDEQTIAEHLGHLCGETRSAVDLPLPGRNSVRGGPGRADYYSPSHNQETQTWVKTGHSGVSIVCEDQ